MTSFNFRISFKMSQCPMKTEQTDYMEDHQPGLLMGDNHLKRPRSSDHEEAKDSESDRIADLANLLAKLTNLGQKETKQEVSKVETLMDMEKKSISKLLGDYESYQKSGGTAELIEFIDEALLESIREYRIQIPNADSSVVSSYLRQLVASKKTDLDRYDDLVAKVSVDHSASTELLMVESLFVSLKRELWNADMVLSFSGMKRIILDKLPGDYKVGVQKLEDIRGPSTDLKELWGLCRSCGTKRGEDAGEDVYARFNRKTSEDQQEYDEYDYEKAPKYNLRSRNL